MRERKVKSKSEMVWMKTVRRLRKLRRERGENVWDESRRGFSDNDHGVETSMSHEYTLLLTCPFPISSELVLF